MKKVILSILLSGLVTGLAHADSDDNNCGKLSIMITNLTQSTCTLVSSNLRHGYYKYTSSVPIYIPANSSAGPIFLEQSIFGPDLELGYSCGDGKLISFASRQNVCFLAAGDVTGEVQYTRNAAADYQAINGSWFWSQHGSINWRLQ